MTIVAASSTTVGKYPSCRFLERAATFFPNKVTACCANPATGLTPMLTRFDGRLSADDLLQGRANLIARHKRGEIASECRNCPRLTEAEWKPQPLGSYALDDVTIAHFTTCNIRCNYCYTVTNPELAAPLSKAPRILPVFEQLIERRLLAPDATVRFSGGEPTLSPEFEPLLALLSNYGARSIVYTNATRRSEAIMQALRRDKVELILGIDAATVETYETIKKMDYNEKVWEVVADYCAAMRSDAVNKVWAKFIFCLENYREAEHFVRRAGAAGVGYVYYDFDSTRVRPGIERAGIALPEEVADYVALLRHECMMRGITVAFAESGLVWLTPQRTERIERELDRLSQKTAAVAPQVSSLGAGASKSDLLRATLIAAQAGLIWLAPDQMKSIGRELEQLNGARMAGAAGQPMH